jgi:hypothetical protein
MSKTNIIGLIALAISCISTGDRQPAPSGFDALDTLVFRSSQAVGDIKLWRTSTGYNGMHCLVSLNGERIDCCLDTTSIQILGYRGRLSGKLNSCYDDHIYEIDVQYDSIKMVIRFNKENHMFLESPLIFNIES